MKKKTASKEIKKLVKLPDDQIDTSDIPEVRDWSRAERGKFYRIKTAIWVDPAGGLEETPEEQIERCTNFYQEELGVKLNVHTPRHANEIEEGTDLVLFDYGGMMYGNDLAQDHSRHLLRWAEDHPNALIVVMSDFTFDRAFRYAIEDHLNLTMCPASFQKPDDERHKTPIHNVVVEHWREPFIPQWFRDAHGCIPDDRKKSD